MGNNAAVVSEVLSDGSVAYNVVINNGVGFTKLACNNRDHAEDLVETINRCNYIEEAEMTKEQLYWSGLMVDGESRWYQIQNNLFN